MKVLAGQLDPRHLPMFFLKPTGRRYVNFTAYVLCGCVLALLIWGFTHLKWYMAFVNIFLAIFLGGPVTATCFCASVETVVRALP